MMAERGEQPALVLRSAQGGSWQSGEQPAIEVGGRARALCTWFIGRTPGSGLSVIGGGPLPTPPRWS